MKYIIANIKVPIEINKDIKTGFKTYMERASIDFTKCDVLPPEKGVNNSQFLSNLTSFLGTSLTESESSSKPLKTGRITGAEGGANTTNDGDDLSSKLSEKKTDPNAEQKTKKAYEEPKLAEEEPMSEEEYHYSSELESDSESESENEINDEMMNVKMESFVLKSELSNKLPKHNNNVSFKKTPSKSSRFTQKTRV